MEFGFKLSRFLTITALLRCINLLTYLLTDIWRVSGSSRVLRNLREVASQKLCNV